MMSFVLKNMLVLLALTTNLDVRLTADCRVVGSFSVLMSSKAEVEAFKLLRRDRVLPDIIDSSGGSPPLPPPPGLLEGSGLGQP